jgi:hypothetical protein
LQGIGQGFESPRLHEGPHPYGEAEAASPSESGAGDPAEPAAFRRGGVDRVRRNGIDWRPGRRNEEDGARLEKHAGQRYEIARRDRREHAGEDQRPGRCRAVLMPGPAGGVFR